MRLTINTVLKLLYGLAFKDILSWPAIFWNQLHSIIDKYYYSMSMKKYSLASVYLIIEAKREIRNQISFDEGGQRTLSLQFMGSQYKCIVYILIFCQKSHHIIKYTTKNVPAIKKGFCSLFFKS